MWLNIFIKGLIVGLVASLPSVGPVGVLSIQRTISRSHKSGFFTGLGSVVADTLFATVAFFSLTVVISFVEDHMGLVQVIGGIFVAAMGAYIFFSNAALQIRRNRSGRSNPWQDLLSGFLLTIGNIAIVLTFIMLFAAFGLKMDMGRMSWMPTLLGVFAGGALWWFALTFAISLVRKKFRPRHMLWLNRIAGVLIMVLGLAAIIRGILSSPYINGLIH